MGTQTDRVQGLIGSIAVKAPCRLATTGHTTLSGHQLIDGVMTTELDRILVKEQTYGLDNGIYLAKSTAWTRDSDWNGSRDVVKGTQVSVTSGVVNKNLTFSVASENPLDVGQDAITFESYTDVASAYAAAAQNSATAAQNSATAAQNSATAAQNSESSADSSATSSQLEMWNAEAEKMTADSYATEPEDVFVKTYVSDGDGTFTATTTTEYSALHWAAKAQAYVGNPLIRDGSLPMTGDLVLANSTPTSDLHAMSKKAVDDRVPLSAGQINGSTALTLSQTAQLLTFSSAWFDEGSEYDLVNSKLVVARAGRYVLRLKFPLLNFSLTAAAYTGNSLIIYCYVNGAYEANMSTLSIPTSTPSVTTTMNCDWLVKLAAGDEVTFKVLVKHNPDTTRTLTTREFMFFKLT